MSEIPDSLVSGDELMYSARDVWKQDIQANTNTETELMKFQMDGSATVVCPFNSDAIRDIYRFETEGKAKIFASPHLVMLLGKGSFIWLDGQEHSFMRSKLLPFFTVESMRNRFILVNTLMKNLMQTLCEKSTDELVRVYPETKKVAYDVGIRAIFGDLLTTQEADLLYEKIEIWYEGWMDTDIEHANDPNTLLGKAMIAKREWCLNIESIWNRGVDLYQENKLPNNTTIYGLINSKSFTAEEMGELMINVIFGAYETTTTSMCNLVYNMYTFKDETKRFRENITDLDIDNFDDVVNNKYVDAFVKESMRIRPIINHLPKLISENCVLNDIEIKKDTFVCIPYPILNFNKNIYEEPEMFDGTRFLLKQPKKHEYVPFGMGLRRCIGKQLGLLELKCIATILAKEYDILYIDETRIDPSPSFMKYANVYGQFRTLSV
eukprot:261913_1